jgi:hypothetical protein
MADLLTSTAPSIGDVSASALPEASPSAPTSAGTESMPKWPGQQSRTNMGWDSHLPPGKDFPYTIISEELFDSEFQRLAKIVTEIGGRADSCTFQPAGLAKNQDRLAVQEWELKDGTWTFAAVFDGEKKSHAPSVELS